MAITQAYILCGGLGSRLGNMVNDTPKPMLPVGGKPILQHTIELLKKHGITKAIFVAGYKADVVKEFFEGKDWGIETEVFIEPELVGTAGAMPLLNDKLDDNFLMVYGDVFIDFDVTTMIADHEHHQALATFLTGPSTHPWDSDLIQTNKEGTITEFVGKKEHDPEKNYLNIGNRACYVINKNILAYIPEGKADFMKHVFPAALAAGETLRVHTLSPGDFVRDMGKPERFPIVEKYLRDRAARENAIRHPKQITCVLLDRDGVINKEVNLLRRVEDIEILPGVREAFELFKEHKITTVIITNQPVIARGLATVETVEQIHATISDAVGGWDALYLCPHHPETQYGDGILELRRGCDCRKPGIGMIMQAREDLGLDLAECAMIGDSFRDVEAGKNAGVRTIFINTGKGAVKDDMRPDYIYDSLIEAAKAIVAGRLNP